MRAHRFVPFFLLAACGRDTPPAPPAEIRREPSTCEVATELSPIGSGASSSAIALARRGGQRIALVVDEDEGSLRAIDVDASTVLASVTLGAAPGHVLVARGRALVSIPSLDTVVELALGPSGFSECRRLHTAPTPLALAFAHDTLLVTGLRALTLFGPDATHTVALSRDPTAVLVDGAYALVTHRVGSIVSVVSLAERTVAREVSFAWRDRVAIGSVPIADLPRFTVQAHGLARVGTRVLAPMVVAYPGDTHLDVTFTSGYGPASVRGVDGYFPHEATIASFDPLGCAPRLHLHREVVEARAQRSSRGRMAPDKPPCLLPRAVAVDGDALLVACRGIDRLLVYRGDGDLAHAERARIELPAGPSALAIDPRTHEAFVWSPFVRTWSRVSLSAARVTATLAIPAGTPRDLAADEGRKLFHTPLGFDGRACASCHPDGRDDGLVWASPHGPMQAPVLAGRLVGSAPFGWLGAASTLDAHLRETLRRIGAKPIDKRSMDHLVAYLGAMKPPEPRTLDARERRGRELFHSPDVACATCHQDGGSDGLRHDVGTGGSFDTPSLAAIGTSAPYMHDGRFATLREAITLGAMGGAGRLGEDDLGALVAYLKTL